MARPDAPARLGEPLLANSLVDEEELEELWESGMSGRKGAKRTEDGLETGVESLDDLLEGGLERGRVVCVSCEAGDGGGVEVGHIFFRVSSISHP